jgi:kumamolisin
MKAKGVVSACAAAFCLVLALTSTAGATVWSRYGTRLGATPPAKLLALTFPLQADTGGLKRLALAITSPGSREYGHYRSIASLARQFGLPTSGRRRVIAYLRSVGATHISADATGLFIDATLPARTAERLFGTTLANYKTRRGTVFTAPATQPVVPAALDGLVTGVVGLDTDPVAHGSGRFARSHAAHAAAAPPSSAYPNATGTTSGCSGARNTGAFTPNQYRTAYQFDPLASAGLRGQGERVALIEIDGYKHSDIATFAKCFGLRLPKINAFGIGVGRPLRPGGEATLDLEVLDAAAPGLRAIDVYESTADERSALKALTAPLQNSGYKPQIISASLGLCEPFAFMAVGRPGIVNTEGALEEAAASGISFLDSSGDSGSTDCIDNSGSPTKDLTVNYPTSSWWVTGVGGTNLVLNPNNTIAAQPVWNDAGDQPGSAAGGGPSGLFHRPPYQLGTVIPDEREVPDVSMLADVAPGYAIYCSASGDCVDPSNPNPWQAIGGTSAATPLLAGGFALVDQLLRMHKRQDLGLANPLLYSVGRDASLRGSVFSDVVTGGNDVGPFIPSTGHQPVGCCSAGLGYDMASGWGSVNLATFAQVAVATQPKIVNVSMALPGHQRPVAAMHITTAVSCTGACLMGAFAVIRIGKGRPFTVYSDLHTLKRSGHKTVKVPFSKKDLGRLRAGLAAHKRIVAVVAGAIVDPAGNIERKSKPRSLVIRG